VFETIEDKEAINEKEL